MSAQAGERPAELSARRVTASATALLLAVTLPIYLIGAVAVNIREDFRFTSEELGLAVAASFAIAAVLTPISGRLIERIGVLTGIRIAIAALSVSLIAIGTVVDSAAALIGCMALGGLAAGMGSPGFSALIAAGVPENRQGTAFGFLTSAPQMAAFMAGLALPLIADPFGWRTTFLIAAAVGLAAVAALGSGGGLASRARVSARGVISLRRLQPIHVMALSAALASAAVIGMRSFLVVFVVTQDFSSGQAGLLLATTGLVAVVTRISLGFLGDRRPGDPVRRAALLMIVAAVGLGLMAVGTTTTIVAGAILAGGVGWGWSAPMNHGVVQRYRDAPAAAIGTQLSGFYSGAVLGPLLVGVFVGAGAFTEAWLVSAGLALLAATVALASRRMVRKDPAAAR
ncbi:MAG: MFS transporter [Solirubrobacterales bacterium]